MKKVEVFKMKFLVFGSLNIDLVFAVDHIVKPGETISASALERSAGGKGANQAAALAKAGLQVFMAGKMGGDGDILLNLLHSYGVDTRHVLHWDGATGQAIIQVDKTGQNSIVLYAGGNGALASAEIGPVLGAFQQEDMVILQNEIPLTAEIMRAAKKLGMKICLNPSPFDERAAALPMELADILFVNEIEGAALAALPLKGAERKAPVDQADYEGTLEQLAARYPAAEIILTAGKAGAFYAHGKERASAGIIDLPVVDTTGAGDTFTGYFLAARRRKYSPAEALALACKAASIAVSRKGAMVSMPFAKEVFGE